MGRSISLLYTTQIIAIQRFCCKVSILMSVAPVRGLDPLCFSHPGLHPAARDSAAGLFSRPPSRATFLKMYKLSGAAPLRFALMRLQQCPVPIAAVTTVVLERQAKRELQLAFTVQCGSADLAMVRLRD